jgi:hypothetical protein
MSHNWAEPSKRPRDPLRRTIVIIEEPTDAADEAGVRSERKAMRGWLSFAKAVAAGRRCLSSGYRDEHDRPESTRDAHAL